MIAKIVRRVGPFFTTEAQTQRETESGVFLIPLSEDTICWERMTEPYMGSPAFLCAAVSLW